MHTEKVILDSLVTNEEFSRKTLPFLKGEYFHDRNERVVFDTIEHYILKYNLLPTKVALSVELGNNTEISEETYTQCAGLVESIVPDPLSSLDWLLETTEQFCQTKAIYNAIHESIKIMDDKTGKASKGAIPDLLSQALSVSFDNSIGHDFFEDASSRYDFYHRREEKVSFDLEILNRITGGGFARKTLNVLLAGCVHPDTKVKIRFRKRTSTEASC